MTKYVQLRIYKASTKVQLHFILIHKKTSPLISFEAFTLPTHRIHCSGRIQSQSASRHRPALHPGGGRRGVLWRWRCPGAAGITWVPVDRVGQLPGNPTAAGLIFRGEISVS